MLSILRGQGSLCYVARTMSNKVDLSETPAEFMGRIKRLEALACPSEEDRDFYEVQMSRAKHGGMNYREALEFVIRERNGGAD